MGESLQVGGLIYTVSDTEWLDHLGGGAAAKVPKHRFLAIRLSITNSGSQQAAMPVAELLGANGASYFEVDDAEGLPDWLGTLRLIAPAQTEHGRLVFDAPPGDYRLKLSGDADTEPLPSVLVQLPYQPPQRLPEADTAPAPETR